MKSHIIQGSDDKVCVVENFFVAAAINESTGFKTIVNPDFMTCCSALAEEYSSILVCADNSEESLSKARSVKEKLGIGYIKPSGDHMDFNEMIMNEGYDAVADMVINGCVAEPYQGEKKKNPESFQMPGMLKEIADYYMATAPKPQPLFAAAAALALGSVVLGRRYTTGPHDNYTSLYIVVAAKSGTGKDHIKQVCRNILKASGLEWMERGEGYTAANTVIKALERQPLQITFFEEIGQKLQEAAANPRSMAKGTFRKLLDVWSSCHSFCVGEEFSDGSVPRVNRPALTLVGLTTPKAFTDGVTRQMIEHGFVNRILPFISHNDRSASPLKHKRIEPPAKLIEFIKSLTVQGNLSSGGIPYCPEEKDEVVIPFTEEALRYLDRLDNDVIALCNELEKRGLEDMPTRMRELSMRVSLIGAVFDGRQRIELTHVQWAWSLVHALYIDYISEIKRNVAGSQYEENKLAALEHLRKLSPGGLHPKALAKTRPWSQWPKNMRDEILEDLRVSELAALVDMRTGKRGPSTSLWIALN